MLSNLAGVTPNKSIVPYASVREFKSGDILLSNIRPYLKKMWFADYDAGCSTDVLVLRVVADVIDSRFLYRVLARDTFFEFVSAKAVGTKMPRGDKRVIAVFQVPIPQLAEQQAIADLLGEQDAAIAALEAKREKYVRIKEGMMRDLLTGKVRMKGECDDK
jgi:restriction endonuclease S subunit